MPYEMPFGKYKGQAIDKVPGNYLEYLLTLDNLRPETKAEVEKELARRRGGDNPAAGRGRPAGGASSGSASPSAVVSRARDIVAVGADRLGSCAYTAEALAWLGQLLAGAAAPDDEVPF